MRASGSTTASGRSSGPKTAVPPQSSRGSSNDTAAAVSATDPRLRLLSIVHDFNNLLTPIVTILEELQGRHVGTSRQLKKIDGAIYCAFCAKVLARQLLDFANPRPASPKPVQIRGLLEPLETALASILSPDIRPKFDITEELPPASHPGGPRADDPPFCRRLGGGDGSPDAEDGGTAEFPDEDQWHRSWPRDRQATDGKFGWWTLHGWRRTRRKGRHSLSRFPFARPRSCPRTTEKIPVGLFLHCR